MLDLTFVRENLEMVERKLAERGIALNLDQFREIDGLRRSAITEVEVLKSRRNKVGEQIGKMKKAGQDASAIIEEMAGTADQIAVLDEKVRELDGSLRDFLIN